MILLIFLVLGFLRLVGDNVLLCAILSEFLFTFSMVLVKLTQKIICRSIFALSCIVNNKTKLSQLGLIIISNYFKSLSISGNYIFVPRFVISHFVGFSMVFVLFYIYFLPSVNLVIYRICLGIHYKLTFDEMLCVYFMIVLFQKHLRK